MGARKHIKAEERKAALKTQYFAKLKGCPSSPRKMRYVPLITPQDALCRRYDPRHGG